MKNWFFAGRQNASARLDELDARLMRRDDITSLLQMGQKISAIKIYREDTGASLADARAAIERMEQQFTLYGAGTPQFSGMQAETSFAGAYTPESDVDGQALQAEIEHMLGQGKKINAIKLYRERTGVGLREAKEVVDQMDDRLRAGAAPIFHPPMPGQQDRVPELNWQEPQEPNEEVRRYLLAGNKIVAIKAYRLQTGCSLKDAKDEIDRLERVLRSDLG